VFNHLTRLRRGLLSEPRRWPSHRTVSTSITRRSVVAGLAMTAAPITVLTAAGNARAQDKQTLPEKSLYERLGGVFAIAAVVDHFSDAVVKNPIVGQKSKNPQLPEWHTKNLGRPPGLKFMRTQSRRSHSKGDRIRSAMSAIGTKRTSRVALHMSAFGG
jgi:hypothetical protein